MTFLLSLLYDISKEFQQIVDDIIKNIIKNNIRYYEKRRHIRVNPKPYESISASIYIKNINRFINGSLMDISAGGVSIKLNDSLEASILVVNNIYDPLLLHIRGMDIKTIARLVGKSNDIAGLKFENVEKNDMGKIATYIHMRILEKSKKHINDLLKTGND